MAEYIYETKIDGDKCDQYFNGYWQIRFVLNIDRATTNTWNWSLSVYLLLGSNSPSRTYTFQNLREETDELCPYVYFGFTDLYKSVSVYKPLEKITSNDGWKLYNTISGNCKVIGEQTTTAYAYINLGWGSAQGSGTGSFVEDTGEIVRLTLTGVVPPKVENPVMVASTSSSISTEFEVDWGYEIDNRKPLTRLYSSTGELLQELPGQKVTFTGLMRYTPYYVEAYAENSQGSSTSEKILMYTKPEDPIIKPPVVGDYSIAQGLPGVASVTVTPGIVEDNGGKEITEIETYIRGGEYGATLNSLGTGSGIISVSPLDPNTTYEVITRATNGITESYSEYTIFITLGNVPEFVDIYASNISLTEATIDWFANYEYNAEFKQFVIEWRYKEDTSWNSLDPNVNLIENTNFDNLDHNTIEYKITVTDSWDRSTSSEILTYSVIHDYSDEVSELECTKNEDDSYTITGTWSERVYNKIESCFLLGSQAQSESEICNITSEITNTGFKYKTKQYKNNHIITSFILCIQLKYGPTISKQFLTEKEDYNTKIVKIITPDKVSESTTISPVYKEFSMPVVKDVRAHDVIKVSKSIQYIDIDSRGTVCSEPIYNYESPTNSPIEVGPFQIRIWFSLNHVSKKLYRVVVNSLQVRSTVETIRVRNNSLLFGFNVDEEKGYRIRGIIPNMEVTSSWQDIDFSDISGYLLQRGNDIPCNITIEWSPEYDYPETAIQTFECKFQGANIEIKGYYSEYTTYTDYDSDVVNNHLVNIKVFDLEGNNVSLNKEVKLIDGSDPLIYGDDYQTTANIEEINIDSNKFIYSENGLPLRLDLGQEYKLDRIELQRRKFINNSYTRNYIICRNKDLEICYILYDSQVSNQYAENYRSFKIE